MTTISEDIFLLGMGVQIDKHFDSSLILHDIVFNEIYLFAFLETRKLPTAVQVITRYVTS